VEDVGPLLDGEAGGQRELRLQRGPAVPVTEDIVALGRERGPGVGLDRLVNLHPPDAGYEDLVLHPGGAAVHREHGAVVEVVVQPAAAVDVPERVALAAHLAGHRVRGLAVEGQGFRRELHRLVRGVLVLLLQRGAVPERP
jgi:hypothetical protein